jgi:hypothetical protein
VSYHLLVNLHLDQSTEFGSPHVPTVWSPGETTTIPSFGDDDLDGILAGDKVVHSIGLIMQSMIV